MYPQAGLELLAFLLLARDSKVYTTSLGFPKNSFILFTPPHAVFLYTALVVLEIPM